MANRWLWTDPAGNGRITLFFFKMADPHIPLFDLWLAEAGGSRDSLETLYTTNPLEALFLYEREDAETLVEILGPGSFLQIHQVSVPIDFVKLYPRKRAATIAAAAAAVA